MLSSRFDGVWRVDWLALHCIESMSRVVGMVVSAKLESNKNDCGHRAILLEEI